MHCTLFVRLSIHPSVPSLNLFFVSVFLVDVVASTWRIRFKTWGLELCWRKSEYCCRRSVTGWVVEMSSLAGYFSLDRCQQILFGLLSLVLKNHRGCKSSRSKCLRKFKFVLLFLPVMHRSKVKKSKVTKRCRAQERNASHKLTN